MRHAHTHAHVRMQSRSHAMLRQFIALQSPAWFFTIPVTISSCITLGRTSTSLPGSLLYMYVYTYSRVDGCGVSWAAA